MKVKEPTNAAVSYQSWCPPSEQGTCHLYVSQQQWLHQEGLESARSVGISTLTLHHKHSKSPLHFMENH